MAKKPTHDKAERERQREVDAVMLEVAQALLDAPDTPVDADFRDAMLRRFAELLSAELATRPSVCFDSLRLSPAFRSEPMKTQPVQLTPHFVTLSDIFPIKSRATLFRWRKTGKVRKADLVVAGREYWNHRRALGDIRSTPN